jgi:xylulokinase
VSLLGLDIGTTGTKGAVYSIDGLVIAAAYREHDLFHPRPGWAELDSFEVWRNVRDILRELNAAVTASGAEPVTALSVSAMGEAVTPVSADRAILAGCIVPSADTRGVEYIERIESAIGTAEWYRINPNIPNAGYTLAKLLWLAEHERETDRRTDLYLSWPDLVQFLLGADPVTNYSHANRTLLFDIATGRWSDRIIAASGIDPRKLPRIAPTGTVVGTVSRSIAAELGFTGSVAVVTGAHDQCLNALGAGVIEPGRAVCGIGTVECITPTYGAIPALDAMRRARLNVEHHSVPGRYVSFVYNQAGSLVKWFRNTFASAEPEVGYDELFAEVPEEPTKLLVLPYFEMTGAPTFISDASGAVVGLKTSTTRGEILKAILEGETFYFAEGISLLTDLGIDTSELTATGGGAKSDTWLQLKADILGIPVVALENAEAGTLGAAINAGVATGAYSSHAEGVARHVKIGRRFEPVRSRHDYYRERYEAYRTLYPTLKELL